MFTADLNPEIKEDMDLGKRGELRFIGKISLFNSMSNGGSGGRDARPCVSTVIPHFVLFLYLNRMTEPFWVISLPRKSLPMRE